MQIDLVVFRALNGLVGGGGVLDTLVVFCAHTLPYIVVILLLWHIWHNRTGVRKSFLHSFDIFFSPAVAYFVGSILKVLIARPRPFINLPGVHLLFGADGFAMPSGHATFYFALALALYYHNKTLGKIMFAGAALISITRVMAGVHYSTDIIAGALLGMIVVYLLELFVSQRDNTVTSSII